MQRGTQIIYIPYHAKGSIIYGQEEKHPDAEPGFVFGKCPKPEFVYCRYWNKLYPFELRTKANSEATPIDCLFIKDTKPQYIIDKAIKDIENEKVFMP